MIEINEKQIARAYSLWMDSTWRQEFDQDVMPFLDLEIQFKQKGDWLRRSRAALFLSSQHLADKLNISKAAYAKYEKNEELGTISLNTLEKAADAMGCELVYAIRPKERRVYSEIVWKKLIGRALSILRKRRYPKHMQGQVLFTIVCGLVQDTEFRREQKWKQLG